MDQRELRDRAAMQAAIEMMRADPEQRELIDHVLNNQSEAALFAVGFCQVKNLHLKAWECPPVDTLNVAEPSDNYGRRPNEVRLLRRMLAAGVSRYDPDPMQALAAAEAKPAA
jgi:hypothetical protein